MPTIDIEDIAYLTTFLVNNGAPIYGVKTDAATWEGIIDFHDDATAPQRAATATAAENWWNNNAGVGDAIIATADGAKDEFRNIPNWATWSMAQAVAWIEANIADSTTRTAIIALAKAVIALRNQGMADVANGQ